MEAPSGKTRESAQAENGKRHGGLLQLEGVIVTARIFRLRNIALLSLACLFAGMPVAQAAEQRPAAFDTFAGISCLAGAYPIISYKGWGVDYARGRAVDVYLDVTSPPTLAVNPLAMTTVTADGNGAWSTPTYSDLSLAAGTYGLHVVAYSTSSHALLGETYTVVVAPTSLGASRSSCRGGAARATLLYNPNDLPPGRCLSNAWRRLKKSGTKPHKNLGRFARRPQRAVVHCSR